MISGAESTRHIGFLVLACSFAAAAACGPDSAGRDKQSDEAREQTSAYALDVAQTRGRGGIGMVDFRGLRLLTFSDSAGYIHLARPNTAGGFNTYRILDERSPAGAALANIGLPSMLHLAWVGLDGAIHFRRTHDLVSWTDRDSHSFHGDEYLGEPALVWYGEKLNAFVAYRARTAPGDSARAGIDQYVFDEGSWRHHNTITTARTRRSPSAARLGNDLVLAWTGWDDEAVVTKRFFAGLGWQDGHNLLPFRGEGHLLAGYYPRDYRDPSDEGPQILWVGRDLDDNLIRIKGSTDGVNFKGFNVATGRDEHGDNIYHRYTFDRPFGLQGGSEMEFAHLDVDASRTLRMHEMTFIVDK